MSWSYVLDDKTSEIVEALAKEDEIKPEEFIKKLLVFEDEKRHNYYVPFVGPKRVKCYNGNCKEEVERDNFWTTSLEF